MKTAEPGAAAIAAAGFRACHLHLFPESVDEHLNHAITHF
jgi:hypothetical protein